MLPTKFGGDMVSKAPHQCLSLETTEKNQNWYHWSLIEATEYFSLLILLQGVMKFFAHLQDKYGSVVGYIT